MRQLVIISIFFLSGLTINVFGQEVTDTITNESIIEQFYQYYLKYPRQAQLEKIEGTIILSFDIDSTCSFINKKQDVKLGYGCDDLAWKTLEKMEVDFKKNNKTRCKYLEHMTMNVPVVFKLR